jgi:hypothetical protein
MSAASLPLPSGAATAANQPAINADGGAQMHVMNFPSTVYGIAIDTNASSNLAALLNSGVGTFGQSYPLAGTATGAKGSGLIKPLIQADSSVPINISTATTTQLVSGQTSQSIYVTHWDALAAGTGNLTFEYGTGSSCGSGTQVITGAYNLIAQAGLSVGAGLGPIFIVPAGNALCALTSAAVQVSGVVSYTQF